MRTPQEKKIMALRISIAWEDNKWIRFWKWIHYFLLKYKMTILKSLLIIAIMICIGVGVYFILKACGFSTYDDFARLKDDLGDTIWFWLAIGLLEFIQVLFIPISNQAVTIPCALLFPDELWKVWLTAWISVWLATLVLYVVGRFGGKKILEWLLKDKEQTERCSNFLKRGQFFYIFGMLAPLPDDLVTILAGVGKFNFWFVLISSFFTRGIDAACSVWGWGFLTRYWWGWIILAVGIILLGIMTFLFFKFEKRAKIKTEEN